MTSISRANSLSSTSPPGHHQRIIGHTSIGGLRKDNRSITPSVVTGAGLSCIRRAVADGRTEKKRKKVKRKATQWKLRCRMAASEFREETGKTAFSEQVVSRPTLLCRRCWRGPLQGPIGTTA